MPYSPSFRDRYIVQKENIAEAVRYAESVASHYGFIAFNPTGVIGIYTSEDAEAHLNFYLRTLARTLARDVPYLGRIEFYLRDPNLNFQEVNWQASESMGDPPATLEELIDRGLPEHSKPQFLTRVKDYPNFFEIYLGIYDRLFPHTEHHEIYTDVDPGYAESSTSHLKKELWRTDLLTRLQGLRFPKLEIELAGTVSPGKEGARVIWEPQGHTNYMIWFNLYVGEDPKACVYVDPTQSGSTTGWLSTRLIKNENALGKLPYTLEQWAVEDLKGKRYGGATSGPAFANYRQSIRELLAHHLPREAEEAWAAIRRQLVGVRHHDLYTEPYAESLTEQYYKPKNGIGDKVYSQYAAKYGGKGTIVDITAPGPGPYDDPEYGIRWDGKPEEVDYTRAYIVDTFWKVKSEPVRHYELYTSDEAGYAESLKESYQPEHKSGDRVFWPLGGKDGTIVGIAPPSWKSWNEPQYEIRWDKHPEKTDFTDCQLVDLFWTVTEAPSVAHHELYTSDITGYAEAYMKSPRLDLSGLTEEEIRDALHSWQRLGPDYSYDALDLPDVIFTWKCSEGYILFGLEENSQIFSVSFADLDFKGTVGVDFDTNKLPGNGPFLLRAVKAKNVDPAEFEPYLVQRYEEFIRLFRIPEHHELYTSGYEE